MPTRGSPACVELRLGLLGEPVDQRADVAALGVGRVDRDRAAGVAEPARVPGQHVEAGLAQRADADVAGRLVAAWRPGRSRASRPSRGPRGSSAPSPPRGAGWKERTICVPSKEVTVASRAWAAAGAASEQGGEGEQEGAHGSCAVVPRSADCRSRSRRSGRAPTVMRSCSARGAAGLDAVHEERERDAAPRRWCCRSPPARRRRAACRSWRGSVLGRGAAHPVVERAVAADHGQRLVEARPRPRTRPCP